MTTKKIVINTCFGGFSLSPKAVQRLAELQGRPCYFFSDGIGDKPYTPQKIEDIDSMFWSAFDIPDPNILREKKNWHIMTHQEKKQHNELYEKHCLTSRPDDRADPLLVQVVEELGAAANGSCASLSVVEIPADVDYEIHEYDGNEHIAEKHRTWS